MIRRIKSSRKDNKYNTHDILSAWRAYIRRTRQYLVADQREKGTKRRCNAPNLPPPRKKTASESWVSGFKQKQASSVNAPLSNSLDIVGSSRPPAGQHYPIRPIQLSTTFLNGSSRFYRLLTRACLSFFRLARPASTKEISALDHETIAHKRPRNGYPLTHQPATYINQSHTPELNIAKMHPRGSPWCACGQLRANDFCYFHHHSFFLIKQIKAAKVVSGVLFRAGKTTTDTTPAFNLSPTTYFLLYFFHPCMSRRVRPPQPASGGPGVRTLKAGT